LWKEEANSWKLVQELLLQRAQVALDEDLPTTDDDARPDFQYDSALTTRLIENSPSLLELYAVRQWLEQTAPGFTPCDVSIGNLQHTRDYVSKKSKSTFGLSMNSSIVDQLDPDAPARQKRALAPEDAVK
jgi:hypothetical protein